MRALRSVLLTYAMYNFDLGYVQVPSLLDLIPDLHAPFHCFVWPHMHALCRGAPR